MAPAISLFCFAFAGGASAATFTYSVLGNLGLDDGHACLSSTAAGLCGTSGAVFEVDGAYALSGTVVYDDVAATFDIDITLASGSFDAVGGGHDGVDEVVFTSLNYVVDDMPVSFILGSTIFGAPTTGTVSGSYEQFSAGGSVVASTAFGPTAVEFTGFSCSNLDAIGLCGFFAGANRDFDLDVGTTGSGDSFDFVHTLNFNTVIPEPGTGSLLALGLVALARRRA